MRRWDESNRLLQGEQLISSEPVPFVRLSPPPLLDDLVDRLTSGGTSMPMASVAMGQSKGEGLFQAEFGRDALVMSAFAADVMPQLTEITVRRLAELQGVRDCSLGGRRADGEQVGQIPHEMRPDGDPIALEYTRLYGWQWPYFGSVDATPLFIRAAARAVRRNERFFGEVVTQRDHGMRTVGESVLRALQWLFGRLDDHPLGLLESAPASNGCWQVWMDSLDAYHHKDGSLARGSLAAVEVQGFVYDALLDAAWLGSHHLLNVDAAACVARAQRLRKSFLDRYVIDDEPGGTYLAAALERSGEVFRPLCVRTANMGMVLNGSLLSGEREFLTVRSIAAQLFDDEGLWCESGIRTLAESETRFRPFSYHNGSVWPWQNLWIAAGLHQHGESLRAAIVESRMKEIVETLGCMPEFVQGGDSPLPQPVENITVVRSLDGNNGSFQHTLTQPAQKFQGWTVFGMYALRARERELAAREAS